LAVDGRTDTLAQGIPVLCKGLVLPLLSKRFAGIAIWTSGLHDRCVQVLAMTTMMAKYP